MTTTEDADVLRTALTPLPPPDPDITAFLNLEARLADEARYSEWELLWDTDALYWVPMHPDDDREINLSYINDNRRRIKSRVAQLNTGNRHSQTPPSVMRRLLSNSEVLAETDDTVTVASNFALFEYRHDQRVWAGRVIHVVRRTADGLRLASKTVHLISAGGPVDTLAFLI
ncbi:aromatic-ring-hydroxylating dioxygenase subunit beta [Gordonia alkanivorans]|uniref:aromatic-ring-hydroxylating dioxygenase subunit beta n=1 Tax=Gordonia alkanivorans TaxID=84096 RepID=UPI002449BD16|nr:aromatic-ring-hydroxylating dioxygenase subunit beta [Gordonia alkanivorans]MDH3047296.1 aromatic-ring-hydroxylating dioxygenase subunit beta [Gordonia alkanivorans]